MGYTRGEFFREEQVGLLSGIHHFRLLFPSTPDPFILTHYGSRSLVETFPQTAETISRWSFDLSRSPQDRALGWHIAQMQAHDNLQKAPYLSASPQVLTVYHVLTSSSYDYVKTQNHLVISHQKFAQPSANCYRTGLYCTTKPRELLVEFARIRGEQPHCLRLDIEKKYEPIGIRYGYVYGPARYFAFMVENFLLNEDGKKNMLSIKLKEIITHIKLTDPELKTYAQKSNCRVSTYEDAVMLDETMCEFACALTGWVPQKATIELGNLGSGFLSDGKQVASLEYKDIDFDVVVQKLQQLVDKFNLYSELDDLLKLSQTRTVADLVNKFIQAVMPYYFSFGRLGYRLIFRSPDDFAQYLRICCPDKTNKEVSELSILFEKCYMQAERTIWQSYLQKMTICELAGLNTPSYGSIIIGNCLNKPGWSYEVKEVVFGSDGKETVVKACPNLEIHLAI